MRKGLESEFYYFYILGNYITVNTKLYHYYSMISKGYGFSSIFFKISITKLQQKSEMRKDIVIELSYKGFG